MNYATADAKLGNRQSRKLQNNTYLQRRDVGTIAVMLHNIDVVTFCADGITVVNSGGWRTVTTKDRINEYADDIRVFSDRGVWMIGRWMDTDNAVLFADGMEIPYDGPILGESPNKAKIAKRNYDKIVSAYVKAFCADVQVNGLALPDAGDCFMCQIALQNEGVQPMGWDHLASHLHEMYFVPSLAFVAMKSHGFKVEFIYRMYLAPDCARRDAPFLARSLRYYFRKHSANIIPHMEDMRVLVAEETASA